MSIVQAASRSRIRDAVDYDNTTAPTGGHPIVWDAAGGKYTASPESVVTGGTVSTAALDTRPETPAAIAATHYMPIVPGTSTTSGSLGVGTLRLIPWVVTRAVTLDRIGVSVTVAGETGAKYRLGIYADNGACYPGTLIVDAGQVAADAVAVPEATIAVTLLPGLYWLGGVVQSVTTTQPTVRTINNWTPPVPIEVGATNSDVATLYGYSQGSVTSTLPVNFTSGVTASGTLPRPFVRIAANPTASIPDSWDYQTGDFSQWAEMHYNRPEQIAVVAAPARTDWLYTARFTVAPGDEWMGLGTERAEGSSGEGINAADQAEGTEQWWAWSTYFPQDLTRDPADLWFIYTQWHQSNLELDTGPPNVSFRLTNATSPSMYVEVRGGTATGTVASFQNDYTLQPIERGRWLDHLMYVKWSSDSTVGRIAVWINGIQRLKYTNVANMFTGQTVYMKQGIYRGAISRTQTTYHTGMRRGNTAAAVAL